VLFDPTGMAPVDCLVRIGTGRRDASRPAPSGREMTRKESMQLEHEPRKTADSGKAVVELAAVARAARWERAFESNYGRVGNEAPSALPGCAL
jgi:hypothetical protein